MAKIHDEINSMIQEMGCVTEERVACSEEEIKLYEGKNKDELPSYVGVIDGKYVKLIRKYPTPEELEKFCMLRQTKALDVIKKCVAFLAGVTAVGLAIGLIWGLYLLGPISEGMVLGAGAIILIAGILTAYLLREEKKDRLNK